MPKKTTNVKFYEAMGRRKSAIARVRLYLSSGKATDKNQKIGKGEIMINDKPVADYFQNEIFKKLYEMPLVLTNSLDRFAISIIAKGGGKHGQLEAIQLGISRALEMVDSASRPLLKAEGLLSRDGRVRERRKVGTGGRARRKKQSPKR